MRLLISLTLAALALAGCLSDQRGGVLGDTAQADTFQGDTADSDAAQVDTSNTPCANGCDDGDPCTSDWCNDGACEHVYIGTPYLPGASCVDDSECDDGDPCTADSCESLGYDACYGEMSYCESVAVPGLCGVEDCASTGCDDGDPCTYDVCQDDGTCLYEEADGCYGSCNGQGVTSLSDLYYGGVGLAWAKTAGRVDMAWPTAGCDDGPDCACVGSVGLDDDGVQTVLIPGISTFEAQAWGCRSAGCGGIIDMTCGEPAYNARYWVWGTPHPGWTAFSGDAPSGAPREAAYAEGLLVEGYCLMTTAAALPGRYAITAELFDSVVSTTGEIVGPDAAGQLHLAIDATTCDICPGGVYPESLAPVTPGDGWIDLQLFMPGSGFDHISANARLYSHENTLSGELVIGGGDSSIGTFWLRRL